MSSRYNLALIDLSDQLRDSLTGNHTFSRFNPSGGLTYKILPGLTVYAGYAYANSAPTSVELSCASAVSPCSLTNFFTGDPSLRQGVSHTIEAGLCSQFHPQEGATVSANIGYYHSTLNKDILFVNSPIQGRAFFQNVGTTLRQGVDLSAQLKIDRLLAWFAYSYIDSYAPDRV